MSKRFDEYTDQMESVYDEGFSAGYEFAWNEVRNGALEPSIARLALLDGERSFSVNRDE